MELNCVLFIPVSSPSGIGEYMRSMIIAEALQLRWPGVNIHFILNDKVSYINDCPYTVHTCKGSPTKDVSTVNYFIRNIKPDLVIFDASGRAKQFQQAKAIGAKVAFISQHNKKRSRGLKINRLLNTDIHWVAQPDYCIKKISAWQQAKLAFFNKKTPQDIGPVFTSSTIKQQQKQLEKLSLTRESYFLFNAGSGGHLINGILAADVYYQAAKEFSRLNNIKSVVIFGSNYPKDIPRNDEVTCLKSIKNNEFIALMSTAKACVISAGDTLLQCLALQKPCVASSISPDQPSRLNICQGKGLVLEAEPTTKSLVQQATLILDDEVCQKLINNMTKQSPVKALEIIIKDIALLFPLKENRIERSTSEDEN
jgi:spore coat polysaccharide biosynthesis predicted glycosyltransferase SpsG